MRILSLLGLSVLLYSCGHRTPEAAGTPEAAAVVTAAPASNLDAAGTARLMNVLQAYYTLKDALVATDAAAAATAATTLNTAADSLKAAGVSHQELDSLRAYAATIGAGKAADVEQQRAAFEKVSDHLFALLQQTGLQHAHVYRQYCPMAFDDKGASWLSNTDEIRNPYFGKKMLECGEVTDSLK